MPPHRSKKMKCIGHIEEAAEVSKARKPRQPKKVLTEEEKEDADIEKELRRIARECKKEWEATLVPWVVNSDFRFPIGTMAMYKSDAKSAYSVSEKEIMALRHESIPCSSKTFFGQEDVKKLAERKRDAGVIKPGDLLDQVSVPFRQDMRLFKKVDNNNRSRRKNFEAQFYGYVDPSMYRRR